MKQQLYFILGLCKNTTNIKHGRVNSDYIGVRPSDFSSGKLIIFFGNKPYLFSDFSILLRKLAQNTPITLLSCTINRNKKGTSGSDGRTDEQITGTLHYHVDLPNQVCTWSATPTVHRHNPRVTGTILYHVDLCGFTKPSVHLVCYTDIVRE